MATKRGRPAPARRVHRLPLTQARIHLGAVIRRAHLGKEYFILEKDGMPVAGLMDIDEFEDYLEQQNPRVREHLRASDREYRAGRSRPAAVFLAALRHPRQRKGPQRRPA